MLEKAMRRHIAKLHEKKHRREAREFLVEGVKGVQEVLASSYEVLALVVEGKMREIHEIALCISKAQKQGVGVAFAGREDIEHIKTTETFPGILAVVAMPEDQLLEPKSSVILALDGVADPGNLGTIIRTADWFGCTHIILGEGCVDPYNDKVVRSTMGSFFRITIQETNNLLSTLRQIQTSGYIVYTAELQGTPIHKLNTAKKIVYVLGSESHGVRQEICALGKPVTVVGSERTESLNVAIAAGIMLFVSHIKQI